MEYKLVKSHGYSSPVSLINPEAKTTIILGRFTIPMMELLKSRDGITLEARDMYSEMCLSISEETAKELVKLTTPMKKAPRKTKAKEYEQPKSNREINAMDVLLGLAKYNNEKEEDSDD